MAMVREQDAFFVVGPAMDFCTRKSRAATAGRRGVSHTPWPVIAAAVAAFTPQALAYIALNGYVGPSQTGRRAR